MIVARRPFRYNCSEPLSADPKGAPMLLRQGDAEVFKKYSQMQLQMKRGH
jgi:hypothetical protein